MEAKETVLTGDSTIKVSAKTEFTSGGVRITLRTYLNSLFSNVSQMDIDQNVDEILQAQALHTEELLKPQWIQEGKESRQDEIDLLLSMLAEKDAAITDLKSLLELAKEAGRRQVGEWLDMGKWYTGFKTQDFTQIKRGESEALKSGQLPGEMK